MSTSEEMDAGRSAIARRQGRGVTEPGQNRTGKSRSAAQMSHSSVPAQSVANGLEPQAPPSITESNVASPAEPVGPSPVSGVGPASVAPIEFMERVVAWPGPSGPGFVNLHWKTPHLGKNGKPLWGGRPFKEIEPFMDMAQWGSTKPSVMTDIFFCLSVQAQAGPLRNGKLTAMRGAALATLLKAIWLDIDVKADKGYATLSEALAAISKFCADANLPRPSALVFSGGGIHVYWISDVPLSVSEWRPYAEGLRAEASRLGLKFDEGVTTDAARILRVPGTFNNKTAPPRACRIAGLGRDCNFAVDLGRLATFVPPQAKIIAAVTVAPFDLKKFEGYVPPAELAGLDPHDSLAAGINDYDDTPLDYAEIFKECPHFQATFLNHGAQNGQGLWMLDVLASTFLDDGHRIAHTLSRGYKTYTCEETDKMWERKSRERQERGLGWPSCAALENQGCKECASCVHRGKINSPLNLAGPIAPLVPGDSIQPIAEKTTAWNPGDLKVSFSNIPHRRWLYGTYLIRGEVTVLAAPGGAGKTALATGMAVEIATGTEILDQNIFGRDLKTLFINGEDGSTEIERRIWAFYLAHAHKLAGQNLDRVYVAGANDARVQRLSFLRTTDRNSMLDPGGFEVLASALDALRPDLLILDPLVAFCGGGNMNDNAVMALVIRELKRLATKFDCAVLIVHHTRKGADDGNAEGISGASSTVNLARRALMPVPMTDKEVEQFRVLPSDRFRFFKLVDAKSNLAPRSADSPWFRLHSVELPNSEPPLYPHGDSVQAVQRVNLSLQQTTTVTTDDQKIQDAILDRVEHGKLIDGQSYPYSPSAAGANNERALLSDAMAAVRDATAPRQWTPEDLKAVTVGAIKNMKADGRLVEKELDELLPKRRRFRTGRGLAVVRAAVQARATSGDDTAGEAAIDGGQLFNSRSID